MPDHVRTQIRAAAVALLAGLSTTGSRVYVGRTYPLGKGHSPSLLIYTRDENSQVDAMGSAPRMMRVMQLFVDARVSVSSPPDDLLDQIAKEVETAIGPNQKFSNLALGVELASLKQETAAEGESHLGLCRLEFTVQYRTAEGAPTTAL